MEGARPCAGAVRKHGGVDDALVPGEFVHGDGFAGAGRFDARGEQGPSPACDRAHVTGHVVAVHRRQSTTYLEFDGPASGRLRHPAMRAEAQYGQRDDHHSPVRETETHEARVPPALPPCAGRGRREREVEHAEGQGKELRQVRVVAGLTQRALAERLGWPLVTVQRNETAQRRVAVEELFVLAPALGTTPERILRAVSRRL